MIRPWYRSRFFWAGIPGLLFLLWAWWDSGARSTWVSVIGPGSGPTFDAQISSGNLSLKWTPSGSPLALSQWTFTGGSRGIELEDPAATSGSTSSISRPRQFDVSRAVDFEKEMDGLGKNPAAHGWVASPGRTLPVSRLISIEGQVAWWVLVLGYLLAGTLFIVCWQYWKAWRQERRGGPRAVISLRLWVPFILLLGLTACFFDSFHTRTRGWLGNGKYHVGWSHYRGLFTASFFREPLAVVALDGNIIREPMREGGFTSRRWPRWLGADFLSENSRELRLPTIFTIGTFIVLWAGVACWRWRRQRASLRKLPVAPP